MAGAVTDAERKFVARVVACRAATGRQFRVTRAGPGDYRVEFRIVPEEDRDARIAEIEAASGLALRSGQL